MKKNSTKNKSNKNSINIFLILAVIIIAIIFAMLFLRNDDKKEVIAKIGGEEIYKSELESKISEIFQSSGQEGKLSAPNIDKIPQEIIKIVVREIYTDKKLLKRAKKAKIHKRNDIRKKIKQVKKAIINQGYIDYIIENEINDQIISETYVNLSNEINGKKEYDLYHIIAKDENTANAAYEELSSSKKFDKVANKYSIDKQSAIKGGSIGFIVENALSPEIVKALSALKKGQPSKPIKTNYGWNIVKYEAIKDAKPLPFEKVKDNIRNQLIQEKITNLKNSLLGDAKIELMISNSSDMNKNDEEVISIEEDKIDNDNEIKEKEL